MVSIFNGRCQDMKRQLPLPLRLSKVVAEGWLGHRIHVPEKMLAGQTVGGMLARPLY